jgi:predicted Ser/Thr protein kinase
MGDNIIGIFLSTESLLNSNTRSADPQLKLQRFHHHAESIECSRLLGRGKHGVVLLTRIKGAEYTLKIVSNAALR